MGMYPAGNVIRVTPTVIAGTTENNDVAFNATEIPNAVSSRGGCSRLRSVTIIDKDNEAHNMDLIFMQVQTNFGTAGSASSITDANLEAAKVLGIQVVTWANEASSIAQDSGTASIHTLSGGGGGNQVHGMPILFQAEGGSTSVYFTALVREEAAWAATDDLEFVFHVEYLG